MFKHAELQQKGCVDKLRVIPLYTISSSIDMRMMRWSNGGRATLRRCRKAVYKRKVTNDRVVSSPSSVASTSRKLTALPTAFEHKTNWNAHLQAELFDADGDGSIARYEMLQGLHGIGVKVTAEEVDAVYVSLLLPLSHPPLSTPLCSDSLSETLIHDRSSSHPPDTHPPIHRSIFSRPPLLSPGYPVSDPRALFCSRLQALYRRLGDLNAHGKIPTPLFCASLSTSASRGLAAALQVTSVVGSRWYLQLRRNAMVMVGARPSGQRAAACLGAERGHRLVSRPPASLGRSGMHVRRPMGTDQHRKPSIVAFRSCCVRTGFQETCNLLAG